MDDDFFDEEDGLFGDDEALDYALIEEMEKKSSNKTPGCLPSIVFCISSTICLIALFVLCL